MYMYMYLRISVPTVQMLIKTNAPVHVKPERQITLISYNYNDITHVTKHNFTATKHTNYKTKRQTGISCTRKKNCYSIPNLIITQNTISATIIQRKFKRKYVYVKYDNPNCGPNLP